LGGDSEMSGTTLSTGSPNDSRATLLRVVTFAGGIYFFLYFLAPESLLDQWGVTGAHESISNGFIAIGAMAIGLGIINIVMSHGARVVFLRKGWFFSCALLVGLGAMIGVTTGQWLSSRQTAAEIRRVQIAGDFAARIVEDAKAGKGKEASFSPQGSIPALSERVRSLEHYTQDLTQHIRSEQSSSSGGEGSSEDLSLLREELRQAINDVESATRQLSSQSWSELHSDAESTLSALGKASARLASTYAIVKRKEASSAPINRWYDFLYNGLFNQLGSAMFALLGVYIAAAAYRAFRIRSVESALMMTAAVIVMLGQISFGRLVYEDMPAIRQWLLEVPNSAAFRAIRLGAGVAGLLLAIRMWLSIESSPGSTRGGKK
jgi:hypothetical protein